MKLIELLKDSYKNGLVTGVVGNYSYKVLFNKEKSNPDDPAHSLAKCSSFEARFHDTVSYRGSFRINFTFEKSTIEITSSREHFINTEIIVNTDALVEMELSDICDKITSIVMKIESLLSVSENSFVYEF